AQRGNRSTAAGAAGAVAVAQRHRHVAQPALVAYAADRRAGELRVEALRAPAEQLDQRSRVEPAARREIAGRPRLCEAIPWTGELAVVAAVDAVADRRAKRLRNRAFQLDRQVGDAAARVDAVRRDDGAGWARVDAAHAAAAVIGGRLRRRQRQVGIQRAQEEGRAATRLDQQRVLAAPAQPGAARELDLQDRCRIAEHAVAEDADLRLDPRREPLQPCADHLVIVAAERITRDVTAPRIG